MLAQQQRDRRAAQRCAAAGREASPGHPAAETQLVELLGAVVGNARGQDVVFPARRRQLEAFELLDHRRQAFGALHLVFAGDVVPVEQEAQEVARAHRLDLGAQAVQRVAVDAGEEPPVAPFELRRAWREAPAQDAALRLERLQCNAGVRHVELRFGDRAEHLETARDDFQHIVIDALEREPCRAALHGPFSQGFQE